MTQIPTQNYMTIQKNQKCIPYQTCPKRILGNCAQPVILNKSVVKLVSVIEVSMYWKLQSLILLQTKAHTDTY